MTGISSLQLVYHIDGDGGNIIAVMDLLNFAQGFELSEGGWIPQVAQGGESTLIETLNFRVYGLSQDAIAARLQVFDDWITRVNYYRNSTMRTAVWLRVRVKGETEYRQALIWTLRYSVGASPFGTMWADNKFISDVSISIERAALWEEITPQSDTITGSNYLATVLTVPTGGDTQARLWTASINAAASDRQNTVYLGFKDDRFFDPSGFYPVRALNGYEAGAGTDVTFVDDALTMGGKKLQCTFATPTLIQRHNLPIKYVTTFDGVTITIVEDTTDLIRGDYLCLMKANITGTAIVRARIKIGYQGASTGDRIYPRVSISDTSRALYEMGVVTFPPDRSSAYNTILSTSIKLDAELVGGAGNLEVDSYILIPLDGALKLYTDDGFIETSTDTNRDLIFESTPVDETYAYTTYPDAPIIYDVGIIDAYRLGMPVSLNSQASALMMAVASDDNSTLKTTSWRIIMQYFRRWRTLRGAE